MAPYLRFLLHRSRYLRRLLRRFRFTPDNSSSNVCFLLRRSRYLPADNSSSFISSSPNYSLNSSRELRPTIWAQSNVRSSRIIIP